MSEEEKNAIADLHEAAEKWRSIVRVLWVLIVGAFMLGGWVTTIQLGQLKNEEDIDLANEDLKINYTRTVRNSDALISQDKRIAQIDSGNWTRNDHFGFHEQAGKERDRRFEILTEQNTQHEIRLHRIEDTQQRTLTAINEIKETLMP